MEILSVKSENFASYKELEFDFTAQGLTLIQGPTGSGKSTLCDLIPWVLFGKTAKGGAVSEVLSWPGSEVTKATLYAENVTIHRSRGPNAKDNDLYYYLSDSLSEVCGNYTRGKDLLDTQRLINEAIGMDYELYLASSYYHEFSQTAQFFTATAKNRRAICEQLVDLSLAKTLQLKTSEGLKGLTKEQDSLEHAIKAIDGKISLLERLQVSESTKADSWNSMQDYNKKVALQQYDLFERGRKKTISKKCNSCGTILRHPHEVTDTSKNPYIDRLADLESANNPYIGTVKDYSLEISYQYAEQSKTTDDLSEISSKILDFELLSQIISDFRAAAITNTIKDVEIKTNQLLTDNFDAEIRVTFDVAKADKLEVSIFKDGNTCSYIQLSKGQRCLLKLCFGVAVMKAVANHHAIQPQQLWFDEALDGLDGNMKEKAFHMLEVLSKDYDSIFVVEHSENLKPLFNNSYTVELVNGSSVIAKTT